MRGQLEHLSQYAFNAAELFGTRPWKLNVTESSIEVHAAVDQRVRKVDVDGRESLIAAGSAVFMLRLALRCHHLQAEVEYTPNSRQPGLLARLRVVGRAIPSSDELELFSLLKGDKGESAKEPPLSAIAPGFHPLKRAASSEGINLRYVEGGFLRSMTAEMLQVDDRLLYQREPDRDSFREWLGISSPCTNVAAEFVAWNVTAEDLGKARAPAQPLTAGEFAVLCTRRDDETNWLKTGMALGHIQLSALDGGAFVTVFNQPLQVPGMRARFARETGFCSFPQVVLRVANLASLSGSDGDGGCGCGE
jgi:hypothetical protein